MTPRSYVVIERTCLALAAGVCAVGGLVWGPRGLIAAAAGALLALANFRVLRWLAAAATARAQRGAPPGHARLALVFLARLYVLLLLVALTVRGWGLPAAPLAAGISAVLAALLVSGCYLARAEEI